MPQTQPVKDFNTLKKSLKKPAEGLSKLKLALLGDSATQLLAIALRATGIDRELDLEIYEADFNQIERQVFDPSAELYEFKPDMVLIFKSSHKLLNSYNKLDTTGRSLLADKEMQLVRGMTDRISATLSVPILYYNYTELNDGVFGNFSGKTPSSFLYQVRKLNYELMAYAAGKSGFYLVDLSSVQNQFGKPALFNPSLYINTEMVLGVAILPQVAALTLDLVTALRGNFKKCVVLDLDNTLWGGVIGDDGLQYIHLGNLGIGKAFTEFQYWIKKLKERGIILAVCSKNTESIAREPFEKHPDMVLQLEDIALFVANWENKIDNIRYIREVLNIGFDAMVFLDDNPFERGIVSENIPQLCVPDLPEDPSRYLEYLYTLNLFETVSFSAEDTARTRLYQQEAARTAIQQQFSSEDDFLASLGMRALVEGINKFNLPRAAQLSQRSNQFNLRTVRYSETELQAISSGPGVFTLTFTLDDRFGANGLICLVILKTEDPATLFIDTWLMSCRVLKRGMENFVLNVLANTAKEHGYHRLKGEYLATEKNALVQNHYFNLGFRHSGNQWLLELDHYEPLKNFIKKIERHGTD